MHRNKPPKSWKTDAFKPPSRKAAPESPSPPRGKQLTIKSSLTGTTAYKNGLEWIKALAARCCHGTWLAKALMTTLVTFLVSGAVSWSGSVKMQYSDIVVYTAIYCGWVVFFLPDVLLHLSPQCLGRLFSFFFRLMLPELVLCPYLYLLKGQTNVLAKGLSLRPLLDPQYQWMEETLHYLRFVLLVGCLSASLVAHLFDRPEILLDYASDE